MWEACRTSARHDLGRPGQRPLQVHERRRHLDRNLAQSRPAQGGSRQDRRLGLRQSTRTASTLRSRPRTAGSSCPTTPALPGSSSTTDRELRQRAFYYTRVYADPKVKDTVYVLNVGFNKSVDAGKTWTTIRPPHGDNHDMWIASNDSSRMIEANDGGAQRLRERRRDLDRSGLPDRAVLPRDHHGRCSVSRLRRAAGQLHVRCVSSELVRGRLRRPGRRRSSMRWAAARAATSRPIPRNPNIFYAGSYGGLITRLDRSTGQSREINPYPDNPMGYASADIAGTLPVDLPHRLLAPGPERSLRRRRSICG